MGSSFTVSSSTSNSNYYFFFFFFFVLTLIPNSISLTSSLAKTPNFDPNIALFGDALLSDDHSRVLLRSSGLLLLRRPFANPMSFSTEFTFSASPTNVHGISLVLVPEGFGSKLSSRSSDDFLFLANVSSTDPKLEGRQKLRSWIDYDATSKRLEVRLAKLDESRPYNPIEALGIDFPRHGQVLIGLASSNSDTEISIVYSWNFRLRSLPNSAHSMPVDPSAYEKKKKRSNDREKRVCPLGVVGGMLFATVCGALMAFVVMFVWAVVAPSWRSMDDAAQSHVESMGFRYEKIGVVVVDKDSVIAKN